MRIFEAMLSPYKLTGDKLITVLKYLKSGIRNYGKCWQEVLSIHHGSQQNYVKNISLI